MANLKRNITYNFVYQLLILFLPFVTAPYLSRILGARGIGIYSYSYSIALYFTYFVMLGLYKYGNRTIAEIQTDKPQRSKVFFEIYEMQIVCFVICAILYGLYIRYIAEDKVSAIIQSVFVTSALFDVNWFFFGMELFKLTVVRNTVVKLTTVACVFIFVRTANDVYKYVLIMATGYLASQLCLLPFLLKYIEYSPAKPKEILKHIKPNLVLFIPVMAVSVYRIMAKIMLGAMSTMDSVGYFENAEKIINVPVALISAVGMVMLPRMAALMSNNKQEEGDKYIDRTMFVVMAFANGAALGIMAIASDFSIWFYGAGFEKTGLAMSSLAVTIIFLGIGNVVRTQYLIPKKLDRIYITSAILGAVVNIVANAILIPMYDVMGATTGTILAELSVCVYQLAEVRKELRLAKYLKDETVFLLFATIMYVCLYFLPLNSSRLVSFLCKAVLGVLIYGTLSLAYSWKYLGINKLLVRNN